VYLYTGMRTKACRKLGESDCIEAIPIEISRPNGVEPWMGAVVLWHIFLLWQYEVERIARADGFESAVAFYDFFVPDGKPFYGQLIKWAVPIS